MDYYVCETINGDFTAGLKARDDITAILKREGWQPLNLNFVFEERLAERIKKSKIRKLRENLLLRAEWSKRLKGIGQGDRLLIQFPVLRHPIALAFALRAVRRRGGRLICLVHDLEIFRYNKRRDVSLIKKKRIAMEEHSILQCMNSIIVHNDHMKRRMQKEKIGVEKLVSLQIFDYLIPQAVEKERTLRDEVVIAGTLRSHKCQYLLSLPHDIHFNLYGVGYEDRGLNNISYFGAFPPDELPRVMDASFGLVWDGDSASSCSGSTGEYLKINNPHKTSLYLASGLPVIIWKEAALADFILENKCGFTVGSLDEIGERIAEISDEEYQEMLYHAKEISKRLREGYYTRKAISQAIQG